MEQTIARHLVEAVARLVRGEDRDASFRIVFEAYYRRLLGFLHHKGVHPADARDLTQDIMLLVYQNASQLREPAQFEAWLFTIARNQVTNYFVRSRNVRQVQKDDSTGGQPETRDRLELVADPKPQVLATLLDREKVAALHEALNDLPEQMRRCVVGRIIQQESHQEIALRLGISVNTVKAHLHKARLQLSDRLRAQFGEVPIE